MNELCNQLIEDLHALNVKHIFSLSNDSIIEILYLFEQSGFHIHTLLREDNLPIFAGSYAYYSNSTSIILASEGFCLNKMVNSIVSARIRYFPILCLLLKDNSLNQTGTCSGYGDIKPIVNYLNANDINGIELQRPNCYQQVSQVLALIKTNRKPYYIIFSQDEQSISLETDSNDMPSSMEVTPDHDHHQRTVRPESEQSAFFQNQEKSIAVIGNQINQSMNARDVRRYLDYLRIPFLTLPSSRTPILENSPFFVGTYYGKFSSQFVKDYLTHSINLLLIGVEKYPYDLLEIDPDDVSISQWSYEHCFSVDCFSIDSTIGSNEDVEPSISNSNNIKSLFLYDYNKLLHSLPRLLSKLEFSPKNIISDVGISCLCSLDIYLYDGDRFMSHHASASMGFALATGLGVFMAYPKVPVWIIVGDGSLLMCLDDLASIGASRANINILLLDNQQYLTENLRRYSKSHSMPSIDWSQLSRSFDFRNFYEVSSSQELEQSLLAVNKEQEPSFIQIKLKNGDLPLHAETALLPSFLK